jgi:AcrR family transcriptional regulator
MARGRTDRAAGTQQARAATTDRGCRLELFEREGFDKTTIEQIAAAADIAPRTFFSYFATKDDLVLADYSRPTRPHPRPSSSADPTDEPAWDALGASFAAVAADYESEADRIRRRFTIMASNPSVFARSLQLQAGWEQALSRAPHGTTRQRRPTTPPPPARRNGARRHARLAPALAHAILGSQARASKSIAAFMR